MKNIFLSATLLLTIVACESGSDPKSSGFEAMLEAGTGQQWHVAKVSTRQNGYQIFQNDTTGEYYAFNLSKFTAGMTYAQYESRSLPGDMIAGLTMTTETSIDSNGNNVTETYYMYGGLRFSNTTTMSRDLELVGSLRDQAAQVYLSHKFQSEYSLSSDRAQELAKLTTRYQRLDSRRALTPSEKNVFAMNALGVNMNQVESAMKQKAEGNTKAYEDMLDTAARVNRTTPEQVGKFFDEMAGNL